jgi:hypothetical protein
MTTSSTGHSDPRETVVRAVIAAMKADYPEGFRWAFVNDDDLRAFRHRLYVQLEGCPPEAVIPGYNLAARARPRNIPSIPEILAGIAQVVDAPKPDRFVRALPEPAEAKQRRMATGLQALAEMREALKRPKASDSNSPGRRSGGPQANDQGNGA